MDRAEAVRRLRQYLPRYVEHAQQANWNGPLPIVNRGLVLYGSTLWKTEGIGDVDLANVVWSPFLAWLSAFFNTIRGSGVGTQYGFHKAILGLHTKSCPRSRLTSIQTYAQWPPGRIFSPEKGEDAAGEVDFWTILWEVEQPDWERVVDQIEQGRPPTTTERGWPEITAPRGRQQLVEEILEAVDPWRDTAEEYWCLLMADIILGWRQSPPFVKEILPWGNLWSGMEEAIYNEIEDEEWAFALAADMDIVQSSVLGNEGGS